MKNIDDILKQALTPSDEPDFWLNQNILSKAKEANQMKQNQMKKFTAVILSSVLVLGIGSLSIYAARKLMLPDKTAEQFGDKDLLDAFSGEDGILINETQSYGGYDVTLLGIVSGKSLTKYEVTSEDGIHDDRTYAVTAIRHSDNTPMPGYGDASYDGEQVLVSPYIQGYDPNFYNAFTFVGGYSSINENGVLYSLFSCDNLEIFADQEIYLGVSDGVFYNQDAYIFDESSGKITRNEDYSGLNALFPLPLDASKADPKAAAEYIKSIHEPEESTAEPAEEIEDPEVTAFLEKLTAENIDEYAVPVESTIKTITPTEKGEIIYEYEIEGRSGGGTAYMDIEFPDKKPGMSRPCYGAYSEGGLSSLIISTFTLNEDGTVTFAAYVPK